MQGAASCKPQPVASLRGPNRLTSQDVLGADSQLAVAKVLLSSEGSTEVPKGEKSRPGSVGHGRLFAGSLLTLCVFICFYHH